MDENEPIDLIALWDVVSRQPTDWFRRHGVTVIHGVICEVRQEAGEMHHAAGQVYLHPIDLSLLAEVRAAKK